MYPTVKKSQQQGIGNDHDEVKAEQSISVLEPVDASSKLLTIMQINLIGQG